MQDKFIIALKIKKTIEYVKNAVDNYPHSYVVLKNNIMDSFYTLLKLTYNPPIILLLQTTRLQNRLS